jgi:hypothetical protein
MSNKQFSITNSPQSTFSIVTPSYNQLDWLRLCVASAFGGIANSSLQIADSKQPLWGKSRPAGSDW